MRQAKKIIAMTLIGVLISSNRATVTAAAESSEKEEVVYIMADAAGKVENVNVVNIFQGGTITDYGNYSSVKMLTSNNKIVQTGDKITFSSEDEKVYYQGTMDNTEIPWNISILYYLDGKQYAPSALAGKSGALEIRFQVTKNDVYQGKFFENYALQASFLLNTNNASDIQAKGATVANVGAVKQLTYTILPGKGIDTVIQAKVTEFEMDGIAINGIKLNLNVKIDDKELLEKVGDIMDATKQLNQGVERIYNGSDKLLGGSGSKRGAQSLNSGVEELDRGIVTLQNGVVSMQNGLDTLYGKSSSLSKGSAQIYNALQMIQSSLNGVSISLENISELTKPSSAIKSGIDRISSGISQLQTNVGFSQYKDAMAKIGLDLDSVKAGNVDVIQSLSSQLDALYEKIEEYEKDSEKKSEVEKLNVQAEDIQKTMQLLTAGNAVIAGTESYLNGISSSINSLEKGAASLQTSYNEFDGAIQTLASTLSDMTVKVSQLSTGINQLTVKYAELNQGVDAYTEGAAIIASSYQQILDGVSSLAAGSNKLLKISGTSSKGAEELYDGVEQLCAGASEKSEGSGEFYEETADMDTQVEEEIDGILSTIEGNQTETVSYVSGKNTNVESVQFVIKTAGIELPEVTEKDVVEEKPASFWQKFIRLFGIGK